MASSQVAEFVSQRESLPDREMVRVECCYECLTIPTLEEDSGNLVGSEPIDEHRRSELALRDPEDVGNGLRLRETQMSTSIAGEALPWVERQIGQDSTRACT